MITVTDINGRAHYLAPAAIAKITEAGPSSRWHGINCVVTLFNGTVIGSRDEAKDIAAHTAEKQP